MLIETAQPWSERYRPSKIADCILPVDLKNKFHQIVVKGKVPNMILAGGPGMGKTSVAKALCKELSVEHIMINGSSDGNIDTVKRVVAGFGSAVSLTGSNGKVIIMDEADHMTSTAQASLRGVIEEFTGHCSFVFTCNNKNKIIDPIHSRCSVIDFWIPEDEKEQLMDSFVHRVRSIFTTECVAFDDVDIIQSVHQFWPDFRRTLNELENSVESGKLKVTAKLSPGVKQSMDTKVKSKRAIDPEKKDRIMKRIADGEKARKVAKDEQVSYGTIMNWKKAAKGSVAPKKVNGAKKKARKAKPVVSDDIEILQLEIELLKRKLARYERVE